MRRLGLFLGVVLGACGSRTTLNNGDAEPDSDPSGVGATSAIGGSVGAAGTPGVGAAGTAGNAPEVDLQACRDGRQSYDNFRQQMVLAFRPSPCSSDADCVSYAERNRCLTDTCELVVNRSQLSELDRRLEEFATGACPAGCPSSASVSCSTALCFHGSCE